MLLLKDIEVEEVPEDEVLLLQHKEVVGHLVSIPSHVGYIIQERVRGRVFIKPNGERVVIGLTKKCQDILGLQYDAWDFLQARMDIRLEEIILLKEKIKDFKKASIFKRIIMVFTGYKNI